MRDPAANAAAALREIERAGLRRRRPRVDARSGVGAPRALVAGRELVDFCSNDYLGLARDPRLAEAMARGARQWGMGAGAAHLVSGHTREHQQLEEELAEFTGREAALLFSTGYMANVGTLTALAGRGEVILADRLNHASLVDGARLSGARLLRYAHASAEDAARACANAAGQSVLLATDGVFSMDGDIAPLPALARLAQAQQLCLLVDDAHGLGVVGATGRGSLEAAELSQDEVPLLMGTLGKALGCFGAFIAGRRELVELVMQRARSYIYTTALPPGVAAAAREALALCRTESWRRDRLQALIARFRSGARQLDLPLADSSTPIQPLILGDTARCLAASQALAEAGFLVTAIRRPTVPPGTERLRVTLSAAHTDAQVDALLESLSHALRAPEAA